MKIIAAYIPMLIMLIPLIYLSIQANRRIRFGKGQSILRSAVMALLIGLVTPFIALVISTLTFVQPDTDVSGPRCYNFLSGFIGIGLLIEVIVIPILSIGFILFEDFYSRKKIVS